MLEKNIKVQTQNYSPILSQQQQKTKKQNQNKTQKQNKTKQQQQNVLNSGVLHARRSVKYVVGLGRITLLYSQ